MSVTKKIARSLVLPLMVNLRADLYYLRKSHKNCCIINFHGVRHNDTEVYNNRHIPVSEFEKIIKYLKANYNIVPLSEFFDIYRNKKKTAKKTLALTFDDGYENNFNLALPVLKKYNVPATYYIISKGLTEPDFCVWPDAVDLYKKYVNKDVVVNNLEFKSPGYYNVEKQLELINYLKTQGRSAETLVKQHFYTDLITRLISEKPETTKLISSNDLKKYANEPLLEFGSHTHSHFCLEYLDRQSATEELKKSKEIIEENTGRKVISLAFPDGSYTKEIIEIASACGYTNQVAVEYKFNEANTNPALLSRYTISNSTTFESNVLRLAKDFDKYGF